MVMSRGGEGESWTEMEAMMRARKMVEEEEVETESSGSSEAETESPRSVGRWITAAAKERVIIHSQVLKIMEEDLCVLLEDKLMMKREEDHHRRHIRPPRRLNLLLISRQNLPCSPLSGKVRSSVNAVQ